MGLLDFFKNWGNWGEIWTLIEPYVLNLIEKNVPNYITKLYENLAKYTQPAIDSLYELKTKISESGNELDDYCFSEGVSAIESFANYLNEIVADLKA